VRRTASSAAHRAEFDRIAPGLEKAVVFDSNPDCPAGGHQSIPSSTQPTDGGRPDAMSLALASLARLALGGSHRQAGDSHRLAPTRLPTVLDLEKTRAHRTTRSADRGAHADPGAV
jgi:hypothetical protein